MGLSSTRLQSQAPQNATMHMQLGVLQKMLPALREHLLSLVSKIFIFIYCKHPFLLRFFTVLQKTT